MANLVDANTQHQVLLTRLGTREARKFAPFLIEARGYIRSKLLETDNINTQKRLNELNRDINSQLVSIYSEYSEVLADDYPEISQAELDFQDKTVSAVSTIGTVLPDVEQAVAAARLTPMAVGDKGSAVFLDKMLKDFPKDEAARVTSRISMGFYNGETTAQIARAISGTRSARYQDGLLNTTRGNAFAMAKTGVTQMSVQAKDSFNKQNDDLIIGYELIATLDSSTSTICKSFDGQEVLYSDSYQPHPPFHYNCRTSEAPLLKPEFTIEEKGERVSVGADGAEEVPSTQTYYTWLKNQPAAFQDDALGVTKGKIFRNAGLSPKEFRAASVDQFNQPLTIEQMSAKDNDIAKYLAE